MKPRFSKFGLVLVAMLVVLIGLSFILIPASFGFSIFFIQFMSRPWNEFISRFIDLQYGDGSDVAVFSGLLINAFVLYLIGNGLERLMRRQKPN